MSADASPARVLAPPPEVGHFIGLMSGTSADGIDAVLVRSRPTASTQPGATVAQDAGVDVLGHEHVAFDTAFRERVLDVHSADVAELARLHVALGERLAEAALAVLATASFDARDVTAIASHGLTVAHIPPDGADAGATLCLGDGDVIAERTGCLVVSDFRARDRAAGGHGAPLVPFADVRFLRTHTDGRTTAALNIGGIANVTVFTPGEDPIAFDTGPGNMLLDAAVAAKTGSRSTFDEDGRLAAAGHVDERWLASLIEADGFLTRRPPRSTGRERYGEEFWRVHAADLRGRTIEDVCATLVAYTVEAIGIALHDLVPIPPAEVVVAGGGALNRCMMERLAQRLPGTLVRTSEEAWSVPVLAREAVAFALLAEATLAGVPSAFPSVTGARRPSVLGKLSLPSPREAHASR